MSCFNNFGEGGKKCFKIHQTKLERRAMLEELTNFAGMVAHDLKTPLGSISGFCGLIQEEELGDEARRFFEIVKESSEKMQILIDELLLYMLKLFFSP